MKNRSLLDPWAKAALLLLAAAGAAAFFAAYKAAPGRALAGLLLGNVYFLMLAAAALVFIAIQYLSGAGWSVLFRRVPEAMTAYLPAGAVLMLAVYAGARHLYPWAQAGAAHDELLLAKAGYLNLPAWAARTALALLTWWGFSRAIAGHSRAQDLDGDAGHTHKARRLSAVFLVVFGITFTLGSIDWIMSLDPHWYSTLFPWYMFGGAFVQAVAALTLLTLILARRGLLPGFGEAHRHDLGKYVFAFAVFWTYLWFCQFLLIWYANLPEEISYYAARSSRGWLAVQFLSVAANFLAPCALLLRASAKKEEWTLAAACLSVCAGRWLDLYVMVMPSLQTSALPHWADLPVFLGLAALFVLLFDRAFAAAAPAPEKDPYLQEGLLHGR